MKPSGYSLVEVVVAAAVVAIGLTAAATLVGALIRQEEVNSAALRAANLQEQAISLYRLGIAKEEIAGLLPEPASTGLVPGVSAYAVDFSDPTLASLTASDGTVFSVEVATNTLVYPEPGEAGGLVTNRQIVVRPAIRAD